MASKTNFCGITCMALIGDFLPIRLVFVYSAENFLENIRNHDVFTTFLYFLEDKYIIREFPNLPRFSLKLPIFRQVVTGTRLLLLFRRR